MKFTKNITIQLTVDYPDGYASEAAADLENLENTIKSSIDGICAYYNRANKTQKYHENITLNAKVLE